MTKEALRDDFISKGWTVEPVANWRKASEVEDKTKYDVKVVSPDDAFSVAQVVVVDDGGAGESAEPHGAWKDKQPTFADNLRAFLDTKEGGTVFAIAVTETHANDKVAEAKAYMTNNTEQMYVVKERNGTFEFQQTT